jgi:hypothetical protein
MFSFVSNEVELIKNENGSYKIKSILNIYEDDDSDIIVDKRIVEFDNAILSAEQTEAVKSHKTFTFTIVGNGEVEIGYKNKREEY